LTRLLRIGTRGSQLARVQTAWVDARLRETHPDLRTEIVFVRTSGDRIQDRPLREVGGKGLFVKELDEALLEGRIDCAVHSLKDLPGDTTPGVVLAAVPEREDPWDVLLTRGGDGFDGLAAAATVGTSSPRRAALVRAYRDDLSVVDIRGNVDTRLRKLERGEVDALVLARAGLRRTGVVHPHVHELDRGHFVPAIGQGALAITAREDRVVVLLARIEDRTARVAVDAERAFLERVGGSCVTPLAAHGTVGGGEVHLRALIASPDGGRIVRGETAGSPEDAARLGTALADRLLGDGGAEILRALEHR
jgi:hydroxymethylbilane synthase